MALSCGHELGLVAAADGAFFGELAHGYACGALMPIHGAEPWNQLLDPSRADQAQAYLDHWGITTRERWQSAVESLLAGDYSTGRPDLMLTHRLDLLERTGTWSPQRWADRTRHWSVDEGLAPADVEELVELQSLIMVYEDRFRSDGLLVAGGVVTGAVAYDLGRAVAQVRWGFAKGWCDRSTAESIIVGVGRTCRWVYSSWGDLSSGYVLGRVIAYDNSTFGHMYTSALGPHQILMSDPQNPWLNLPFR